MSAPANDSPCPPEALAALSRLNVHARAFGCGKQAIYAYKTFVACEFATEARAVEVSVSCHHCSGTGIYRDWNGCKRGPCYRCTKGVVILKFIESRVGDFRCHHPYSDPGMTILRSVWGITSWKFPAEGGDRLTLSDGNERELVWEAAGDWAPNTPGCGTASRRRRGRAA
jgi:hypothetical protein